MAKNHEAFSNTETRLTVIQKGLKQLIALFTDIEGKLSIWVSNDPVLQVDPNSIDASLVLTYISRWPLYIHLGSACLCFGFSAVFHLFQIHSHKLRSLLLRLDLSGICFLIMGSGYPLIFYAFACEPSYYARNWFCFIITASCLSVFAVVMMPKFNQPQYRPIRGFMFVVLGLSMTIPLIYLKFYA